MSKKNLNVIYVDFRFKKCKITSKPQLIMYHFYTKLISFSYIFQPQSKEISNNLFSIRKLS